MGTPYLFSQTITEDYSLIGPMTPLSTGFWTGLQYCVWISSHEVGFTSTQKAAESTHDNCAAIVLAVPLVRQICSVTCRDHSHIGCCWQSFFKSLHSTSSTVKVCWQEASSPVPAWSLHVPQPKCVVSLVLGSYHLVLVKNQQQCKLPYIVWRASLANSSGAALPPALEFPLTL